ncbi:RNA polymerase sigma factor FliA [Campylobacter lanienae]|uniref:RNA polymerase sigma factor FliA n=1 Tax=Campylobacter lanienae TaxID=75658 RepID=UPI00242C1AD3|nr:RNA polymerase sigma factor FliA [Campylobacter lanienae]MCI5540237.1 RNA polymerase sigma factor FliA [Campylobacter lanienae]MDD7514187.1 RNA polymerase sigma factor FliA [Campylobacter lanienae]MDY5520156.1 RNA polymerase sigma factor FliA [Campylobacter lanienae]
MNYAKQKQLDIYKSQIKKEQDDLVIAYMPAVKAMAYRLKSRLPSSVEVSDLISVGSEAMVRLSHSYDKSQNDNFWGYVKQRVYGSMLDYLRTLDSISRNSRKLVKDIDRLSDEYYNKHQSEPSDEYLAKALNEDISKIKEARNLSDIASVLRLEDQYELLSEYNTEAQIEKDELIEHIKDILSKFSERDQMIIQLYYYEELSLKEISEILNITESRISQIHKRLITKIRERLGF